MKKITVNFSNEVEIKNPRTKTVQLEALGETYEVVLKNQLTIEERVDLFTKVTNLFDMEEDLDESLGTTLMLIAIYQAVTDIEAPESPRDQVAQFNALLDSGLLKKISEELKPGLVEDLAAFLAQSVKNLTELTEEKIKEIQKPKLV